MIPILTLNKDAILKTCSEEIYEKYIKDPGKPVIFEDGDIRVPVYYGQPEWVDWGAYKEYVRVSPSNEFSVYGYCDTKRALVRYLKPYLEDKDNDYYVSIGFLNMDNEKVYKFGSYINEDGEDTEGDYSEYIRTNPEIRVEHEFIGDWLTFSIRKLIKN